MADQSWTHEPSDMSSFLSTRASIDSALSRFSSCSSLYTCFSSTPPQSRRCSETSDMGASEPKSASPGRSVTRPSSIVAKWHRRFDGDRPPIIAPRKSSLLVDFGPGPDLALRPTTNPDAGARRAKRSQSMEWRLSLMQRALLPFVAPPSPRLRSSSSGGSSSQAVGPFYAFGSAPRPRNHHRTRRFTSGRGIASSDVPSEAHETAGESERRRSVPRSVSDASIELRQRIEAHELEERTRCLAMRRRMGCIDA